MSDYADGYINGYAAAMRQLEAQGASRIPVDVWRCPELSCPTPWAVHVHAPRHPDIFSTAASLDAPPSELPPQLDHDVNAPPPLTFDRPRFDYIGRDEARTTSATGGQKGDKLARFDLIPAGPLWLLAELYGIGARKYEDRNWERGYPWHLSFAAANRHMSLFWQGEDNDDHEPGCDEGCVKHTGLPHPICAVFHMLGLTEFMTTHRSFDDRPSSVDPRRRPGPVGGRPTA